MQHGFTEAEWLAWIDDTLDRRQRTSFEAHLAVCAECSDLAARLRRWDEAVAQDADRWIDAAALPGHRLESLLAETWKRIEDSRPACDRPCAVLHSAEALVLFRRLLEPICGATTARNAIRIAIERSAAPSSDGVSSGNWSLFVANLRSAVSAFCSLDVDRLIEHVGGCVAVTGGS